MDGSASFLSSIENIPGGRRSLVDNCPCEVVSQVNALKNEHHEGAHTYITGGVQARSCKSKTGQSSNSSLKRGSKKVKEQPIVRAAGPVEKGKGTVQLQWTGINIIFDALVAECLALKGVSLFPPSPYFPYSFPSPMETHLWFVVPDEFKSVSLLNQYMELLSPCEKENVLSMRGEQLQKQALLARTLVRTTIARYQINNRVVDPRSLKFKRNVHGKPELEWESDGGQCPSPLHFNISHTSSLIACGVTVNSSIGIDIEEKQRKIKNNILAFARRYFSLHEVEHLSAISDPEVQRQEFVKLWTLKVSVVLCHSKSMCYFTCKAINLAYFIHHLAIVM
ncbi:4'-PHOSPHOPANTETHEINYL TRANSFERASE DOMAIN PROTEIN-RELATED [Salix viminalis]|uniref:holo-[acyl-carrier-protein] synthase n=1 Tax=Salix viminalis TaxID=40686 RepID=A0A9Q0V779_SALVM|nr:4'-PHOSPHOPANTETHEINYL TRANSFERASE DOMAIN PROTEIN-RELATED [Salix viminalis]